MSDTRPCPRCGCATDDLKAYRLPTFLLFFIGASFGLVYVSATSLEVLSAWNARCEQCRFDVPFTPALEVARRDNPAAHSDYLPPSLFDGCTACGGTMRLERKEIMFGSQATTQYALGLGETAMSEGREAVGRSEPFITRWALGWREAQVA